MFHAASHGNSLRPKKSQKRTMYRGGKGEKGGDYFSRGSVRNDCVQGKEENKEKTFASLLLALLWRDAFLKKR